MSFSIEREKLLEEVNRIPDDKLRQVYEILHYFRIGVEVSPDVTYDVMHYAGSWRDMPEEDFANFIDEISTRRRLAFSRRLSRETRAD